MAKNMPITLVVQRVDNVVLCSTANFSPRFWGDHFLTYTSDDMVSE